MVRALNLCEWLFARCTSSGHTTPTRCAQQWLGQCSSFEFVSYAFVHDCAFPVDLAMQIKFNRHFVPCFSYDEVTRAVTIDMRNFQATHVRLWCWIWSIWYMRIDECSWGRWRGCVLSSALSRYLSWSYNFRHVGHYRQLILRYHLHLAPISFHISTPGGRGLQREVSSKMCLHRHSKADSVWVISFAVIKRTQLSQYTHT